MRFYDIKLDRRGWAQLKSGRRYRSGLPWTPAEDRALLRRLAKARSIGYADPTMRATEAAHGRSYCAIATRASALRAGIRLATSGKGVA